MTQRVYPLCDDLDESRVASSDDVPRLPGYCLTKLLPVHHIAVPDAASGADARQRQQYQTPSSAPSRAPVFPGVARSAVARPGARRAVRLGAAPIAHVSSTTARRRTVTYLRGGRHERNGRRCQETELALAACLLPALTRAFVLDHRSPKVPGGPDIWGMSVHG